MKGKQLATLLAILAVLGTAGWLVLRSSNSSWSEASASTPGAKVIALPINDVAKVTLRTAAGELNLNRKDDGWTVAERADFPANFESVSTLLRKINDLKTVQEVKAGPSQLPRLELVEPTSGATGAGTLVDMKDGSGKSLGALLLGKKYLKKSEGAPADAPGYPAGRYVMPVGKGGQISLVADSFEDAEIKPERWLSKEFFRVESPRSIELSGSTPARKWKVTRETPSAEWVVADLQGDEKTDQSKINSFAGSFGNATFSDVLAPDAKPEVTGLDQPTALTVETFDGFRYEWKIGKPQGEGYAATIAMTGTLAKERTPGKDEKPEDKEKLDKEFAEKAKRLSEKLAKEQKIPARIYVMPKYSVDPLLKDRSGLLADKPAATPTPAPVPGVPPVAPVVPAASAGTPSAGASVTTPPVAVPPVAPPAAPKASPSPAKKGAK